MSKIIFLDTNIFLHYKPIQDVDWRKIVQSEKVIIVIPPISIRELNGQKELHPHKRIRERAQRTIQYLYSLFEHDNLASIRDGIELKLESHDPVINFEELQLNKEVNDDVLMGNIQNFLKSHPDKEVILITSDRGLTLIAKAHRFGFPVMTLGEEFKLPEEPDPDKQQIQDLEKRLLEYSSKTPKLALIYEDGNQSATFFLSPPKKLSEDNINTRIDEIRTEYPELKKKSEENFDPDITINEALERLGEGSIRSIMQRIHPDEIDDYNSKLNDYYELYKKHILRENKYLNYQQRTIELRICLANDGTAPAEDIDILLKFPNGFNLYSSDDFPPPPLAPLPPDKPVSPFEKAFNFPSFVDMSFLPPQTPGPILPPPNVSSPTINRVNSFEVEFHVIRLKHTFKEILDPLFIVFDSYDIAGSFHIEYIIVAGNIPNEIVGKLHIVIDK